MKALEASGKNIAYLYDGTLEGLLSAVFHSYELREVPDEIVRDAQYEPRIGQDSLVIAADNDHALRVRKGIERMAGRDAFTAILRASTCDDYETGTIVYRFVRFVMARPAESRSIPVLDELAHPHVAALVKLERHAVNECEKMRQFIRFSHLENGVWYARCNPNASVVPLIMGHFATRLNDQPFIIYDENHHVAGVYDGFRWQLVEGIPTELSSPTQHDLRMQAAWKRFYDALSIEARYHPELRRQFLPVRFWSTLPEMNPL